MSQQTAVRQRTRPARPSTTHPKAQQATPRLRVVQPADTHATEGVGFVVACLLLLVSGLVVLLLLNTVRAQQSFTMDRLQAQSNTLSDTQQELQSDLDNVSAPQQLALKAQSLGLRPASKIRYVRKSDGKVLGVAKDSSQAGPFTVGTLPTTPASQAAGAAQAAASAGLVAVKPKPAKKPSTDGAAHSTAKDSKAKSKSGTTSTPKTTSKPSAKGASDKSRSSQNPKTNPKKTSR
ncbi:hypothetical protein [Leekyejoonella antrihumi]|uniref:Cell division protein FtsL n=1 Tax=Leekyejoonella antrihumi TaxID=1660198 RepID=A0A563DY56_9MICO|nr:hypothetical protein [Leekyejoonella antrihumi]TWP35190.1 hypothetical protein FGL98_14785 [Leekyejoonella antrihumi]